MINAMALAVLGVTAGPLAAQQIIVGGDVNHALPSPPPTDWNVGGSLGIGTDGAGEMHISSGGSVESSGTNILGYSGGSSGTVTVDGKDSTWTTTGNSSDSYFAVGMMGNGTMIITNGGAVYCNGLGPGEYYDHSYVGSEAGSTGLVLVDGEGSTWGNSGNLYVGNVGNGTLTITDGGNVYNQHGIIGQFYTDLGGGVIAHGAGIVTVDGDGSTWTNNGTLTVGSLGEGSLNITNGGSVFSLNGNIGNQASTSLGLRGTGIVTVDGKNSTWTNSGTLVIGTDGDGTLIISNGGAVSSTDSHIARHSGSTGTVTVDGKDSTWTNSGTLIVGEIGNATLTITNGGNVSNTDGTIGQFPGASGIVTVSGKNSKWTNNGTLSVCTGTLTITSGGAVSNTTAYLGYGYNDLAKATVDGNGSTWDNSGSLYVGTYGSGELAITNGGKVSSTTGVIAYDAGSTGKVTVKGVGSTWTNTGNLYVGYAGAGELHLKQSGIVNVAGSYSQKSNGWLELDIGNLGSCRVTVGTDVYLDGILQLTLNGWLDA
ncbi:MAG: hypothetical protein FWD61_13775, partial [Phycisphaerales bacterium]|nr:hypothetical protein [Phycisphaerales bacterium]